MLAAHALSTVGDYTTLVAKLTKRFMPVRLRQSRAVCSMRGDRMFPVKVWTLIPIIGDHCSTWLICKLRKGAKIIKK